MTGESWRLFLVAGAFYLLLHLAVYATLLRRLSIFRREKPIFLYHFVSACLCSVAALAFALYGGTGQSAAAAISLVFGHGIYSLSFLELWTLSQISYSREILVLVRQEGRLQKNPPPAELVRVGDSKKAGRLESLFRLRLLERRNSAIALTARGRILAGMLRWIAWLANLRQTG